MGNNNSNNTNSFIDCSNLPLGTINGQTNVQCSGIHCVRWNDTSRTIWGGFEGIYTSDSNPCLCARHAGIVGRQGGSFLVSAKGRFVRFVGSTANGVQSKDYGEFQAISISMTSLSTTTTMPLPSSPTIPPMLSISICSTATSHNEYGKLDGKFVQCVGAGTCAWRGRGTVWGSGPFTQVKIQSHIPLISYSPSQDSCLCDAARWCGIGDAPFLIRQLGKLPRYAGGGLRNGVNSVDWGRDWNGVALFPPDSPECAEHIQRIQEEMRDADAAQRIKMEEDMAAAAAAAMETPKSQQSPPLVPFPLPQGPPLMTLSCNRCVSSVSCLLGDLNEQCHSFERALTHLFDDAIVINTSSCQRCYLRVAVRSVEYVVPSSRSSPPMLLFDTVGGRELLAFSSTEERRAFALCARSQPDGALVMLPEPLWEMILERMTLVTWATMGRVSRFFCLMCKRQEERRLENMSVVWGRFVDSEHIRVHWILSPNTLLGGSRHDWGVRITCEQFPKIVTIPWMERRGSITLAVNNDGASSIVVSLVQNHDFWAEFVSSKPIPQLSIAPYPSKLKLIQCNIDDSSSSFDFEGDLKDAASAQSIVFFSTAPLLRIIPIPVDRVEPQQNRMFVDTPLPLAPETCYSAFVCPSRVVATSAHIWIAQGHPMLLSNLVNVVTSSKNAITILDANRQCVKLRVCHGGLRGGWVGVFFASGHSTVPFKDAWCWIIKSDDSHHDDGYDVSIPTIHCPTGNNVELEIRMMLVGVAKVIHRSRTFVISDEKINEI